MWRIINVITAISIAVLGALLGGQFDNRVHILGLVAIIAYAITMDFLIKDLEKSNDSLDSKDAQLNKVQQELTDTNLKLSQILVQSNLSGENRMYLAVSPTGLISCSNPVNLQIIMNAPFSIHPAPDLRLVTKKRWGSLKVDGRSIYPQQYAGGYEYTLLITYSTSFQNNSNKFFVYTVEVEFQTPGVYEFSIEARSTDFTSVISNAFDVA